MALLSVIRRWAFRDQLSIREISRRTGLSRNTIRKYLRAGSVEPKFKVPDRPSKLDAFADKLSGWLKVETTKSRKQKRTSKQMHADLVTLGFEGSYSRVAAFVRDWKADRSANTRPAGAEPLSLWSFSPAKRFNLIGARTGRSSAANAPNCRWRTLSCRTAAPLSSGLIFCRPTRCCLTPIVTPSVCSAACRSEAFMTICAPPLTRWAAARTVRSTPGFWRWSATICSTRISAIRLPAGKRGKSRRTSRTRATGCGSRRHPSPIWPP